MKLNQLFITWTMLLLVFLVSACAPASSQDAHAGHPLDAAPVSNMPEKVAQPGRTVKVNANDQMRFVPETLTVRAGETITFEVANTGALIHEFIIGDAHVHEEHAKAMAGGDSHHSNSSTYALSIAPGKIATLTYTFDQPGEFFYGCHVPGHYDAGMKGTIAVVATN